MSPPICYGPADSENGLIYFHGLDIFSIGSLERSNRRILKKLAEQLGIRVALPRAKAVSPDGEQLCWEMNSREVITKTMAECLLEVEDCLSIQSRIGALGFSNGGYFLGKAFQLQLVENFDFLLLCGSAGAPLRDESQLLSSPPVSFFVGEHDVTLSDAKKYYQYLKSNGATVEFATFPGNHELDYRSLRRFMDQAF